MKKEKKTKLLTSFLFFEKPTVASEVMSAAHVKRE
jgi:hypothetical protein